jgi:multiple sugar transport system permease protein
VTPVDVPTRRERRVPVALLYAGLVVAAGLTVLPFLWVISGSLRSIGDFQSNPGAWLPSVLTVSNYTRLFRAAGFGGYLVNSLVVAALTVCGNVMGGALAGYALAKLEFRGKRIAFAAVMVALMMPFSATFVPQFMVTVNLGLVDTRLGVALPGLVLPISVFIVRQYANSIPDELIEAARIDGASELRIFRSVFLPLAGPALATTIIMSFLASWNSFIWPLIVAQQSSTYTLPVGLAATQQAAQNVTDYGLVLAGAVVVMLPVLVVFLFLQRFFVQGIAATGLK